VVEKTILLPALDCSKSLLDFIFVLFTTLPSDKVELPRDIWAGARQPGGLFPPEAASRHIQSIRAHIGQYCGRNHFFWPDLIFERIGSFFSAERVKNEHNVKQTPNGGGGNFVTFNIEKAYLL